ncbi:hypothetical protein E3N88_12061 [Mikania micrantha]|uniref:Uncharacterized protein n=1 Tax=Mikania micrantha TaxID=192012 RepID=A0A5N6P4S0_9ASTR|nr:hypothetical protein E3N88_12061 [Mikania micrantha]
MADLRFVPDHNMSAYLGDPPERHSEFKTLVEGLIMSPVNYAIMEHPTIVTDFVRSFWNTVEESTYADGNVSIIGRIQGQPITVTEQLVRECLQFGDKADDSVELDQELFATIQQSDLIPDFIDAVEDTWRPDSVASKASLSLFRYQHSSRPLTGDGPQVLGQGEPKRVNEPKLTERRFSARSDNTHSVPFIKPGLLKMTRHKAHQHEEAVLMRRGGTWEKPNIGFQVSTFSLVTASLVKKPTAGSRLNSGLSIQSYKALLIALSP